jgi:two-component sensor histidine kinase
LIVSELVTNAFKYAFPAEESGNIWIKLKPTLDGSSIQLSVSNNGVPFDFRAKAASEGASLGMTLIESLTEQLKGDFQIRQEEGIVDFYITFPKPQNAVYIEEQDAKLHPNSYR